MEWSRGWGAATLAKILLNIEKAKIERKSRILFIS